MPYIRLMGLMTEIYVKYNGLRYNKTHDKSLETTGSEGVFDGRASRVT